MAFTPRVSARNPCSADSGCPSSNRSALANQPCETANAPRPEWSQDRLSASRAAAPLVAGRDVAGIGALSQAHRLVEPPRPPRRLGEASRGRRAQSRPVSDARVRLVRLAPGLARGRLPRGLNGVDYLRHRRVIVTSGVAVRQSGRHLTRAAHEFRAFGADRSKRLTARARAFPSPPSSPAARARGARRTSGRRSATTGWILPRGAARAARGSPPGTSPGCAGRRPRERAATRLTGSTWWPSRSFWIR